MSTTQIVALLIAAVFAVFYVLRRRNRLGREDKD